MKFARYLEDTQTPEWQRAYLNYRLLKKRITAIRRANGAQNVVESPISSQINAGPTSGNPVIQYGNEQGSLHLTTSSVSNSDPARDETTNTPFPDLEPNSTAAERRNQFHRSQTLPAPASINSRKSDRGPAPSFNRLFSSSNSRSTRLTRRAKSFTQLVNPKPLPYSELPLCDLLPLLSAPELAFFSTLDGELDKIESFYVAREKDMKMHTRLLEQQLHELNKHGKIYAIHSSAPWTSVINRSVILNFKAKLRNEDEAVESAPGAVAKDKSKSAVTRGAARILESAQASSSNLAQERGTDVETDHGTVHLDPDDYHDARHKLKRAVLEHYRGLEMLHNYRVLNITGIRKALKKFEKVTKIAAQNAYMSEKVDKSAFASEANLRSMLDEMEEMYALRFAHGDKKKALNHLRSGQQHKSHHVSTFWSGIFVGLAAPAIVSGLYHSYQQSTRDAIPGWDALLLVYSVFLIPVVFSLLVGLNLLVWARSRINYVFIFELDLRTRLDHREYFETPSILLATLCYAFWLSFAQIGVPSVSPTIWPLVWLAFTATVLLDPFPVLFKPSRYWLLRNVGKLMISGTRRVEFTDFWMGDQFCSLVFTLSNLYLVVCLYVEGFSSNWRQCGSTSRFWPLSFVLAILPFLVRLVQSIKRYVDSGLTTHLINGGKYGSGIVSYLCYFIWRHKGRHGPSLVVWCFFNVIYSTYALSWDFLMDWSILRLHVQYPLLRKEIVYTNHIYLYYLAILSNTLIRFIWVIYIPTRGPDITLRTFIVASFEMLRRWQWNFYRVENEHLGNVDQYRVTREVPLPYSLDDPSHGDDGDEDGSPTRKWSIHLRRRKTAVEVEA